MGDQVGLPTPPSRHRACMPVLAKCNRSKIENLHGALDEPAVRDGAPDLLRSLVGRIDMNPADGGFEITLTSDIARIMALSIPEGKRKKAIIDEKTTCAIRMVARPAVTEN